MLYIVHYTVYNKLLQITNIYNVCVSYYINTVNFPVFINLLINNNKQAIIFNILLLIDK